MKQLSVAKKVFQQLINDRASIEEFENWVYLSEKMLSEVLDSQNYLKLISFNFKESDTKEELKNILEKMMTEDSWTIVINCTNWALGLECKSSLK